MGEAPDGVANGRHRRIHPGGEQRPDQHARFFLGQIAIIDIVFSLDSVITAVGMTDQIVIMVAAVLIAVTLMLIFVEHVARFVEAHPTVKMLALSYMLMIGVMLVADGFGFHIPHGYVYSAMGFSAFVEGLNYFARSARMKRKANKANKANNGG